MSDAEGAADGRFGQQRLQPRKLSCFTAHFDAMSIEDGDARRIIPTIFQTTQTVHDNGGGVTMTDVTDDSTHGSLQIGDWGLGIRDWE
jgi:hypothetical protein